MAYIVVVFDCETLTDRDAPSRLWCGPEDPDPLLVQIGAVRLSLQANFDLGETFERLILPEGRAGRVALPAFFSELTGVTEERLDAEGMSLSAALTEFAQFCTQAPIYSWGKDEITSLAPACFVSGLISPIPAARFHNATSLVLRAGEPLDVVHSLHSHTLAEHFGLAESERAHDAVSDAISVAKALQHLLRTGRLEVEDLLSP